MPAVAPDVVAFGLGTEVPQALMPEREAARIDRAADTLGAWLAVLVAGWIGRRRGRQVRPPAPR